VALFGPVSRLLIHGRDFAGPGGNEMAGTCWIAGVMVSAVVVTCPDAAAQTTPPLSIKVFLHDWIGVPPETLQGAREEASRIFETAGIRIVWVEGEDDAPQTRYLVINMTSKAPGRLSRNPNILGVASGSSRGLATTAWVFYERIKVQHGMFGLTASQLLGHVMAHEMGHLLLADSSHTSSGLMKGGWDKPQARLATMGSLRFHAEQAAVIRARLKSGTSP